MGRVRAGGLEDPVFEAAGVLPTSPLGVLPLALVLASCAGGRFEAGVYRNGETAYRIGALDSSWLRFDLSGSNLAFRNRAGGSILVNATCQGIKDVPLDVLVNQALIGVDQKHELGRERFTLDGREALRARLAGTLDGVPLDLDLVVLKKDNCTYDLELVAGDQEFPSRDEEFWRFVQGFQQLPAGSG
jgi:hypothetical protein